MSSKKGKRQNTANKVFPVPESVSIALKIQLDKFLSDDKETELKFPTFLSAQERGFIHARVAQLGLKSKSRGKGVNRFITIYKRAGSSIVQNDAKLILDSNMRCTITELFNAFPITAKEKEDLSICPEKERSPQLVHKAMGQLNNGVAQIPNTSYNPEVMKFREKLPIYEHRHDLIDAILHNQVIIVSGATGCGKTTQLPQLVLEHCQEHKQPARVYCTQPRRISAVSVAERVAYERNEKIGQSIGYQIRLESRVSPRTVLTYCTNGILLRTLMGGESSLTGVTHVFVDEVHERDKFSDFLLIALRDALPRLKDLKLILMSATADTQIFSRYFNNCPVVTIPGRLFEVQKYFLEDILKITQYRTKKMVQAEKELKHKLQTGQSYWSHLEGQKTSLPEEGSSKDGTDSKAEVLEPSLQADMDEFLDDCFNDGSLDSFSQILYMYLSEGVSVQCAHSHSARTGLMAAARHGLHHTVAHLLQLGADPTMRDSDGKTALEHATEHHHAECVALLAEERRAAPAPPAADEEPADSFLLDVYHHTVSEDAIDHDLLLALVKHIHVTLPRGSILVFLPGYEDIVGLRDRILACADMAEPKYQIFTLHSNMQTFDQRRVFEPLPGARKIIVATNIAETSITIDDVAYVVDSGKVKEKYYESAGGVCSLRCGWRSRACAEQRAGRAGRTQPGRCYVLCSRRRHAALPRAAVPEVLRVPLAELCLHTKLLAPPNTPVADFLARALEPPSFLAVRDAVALLKTIGALTPTEDLTEIGRHLLDLSVEPKLGKMLLYACVLKCLDPVLTIVCSLAEREPFQLGAGPEARRRAHAARRELAADAHSDHMALLRAFQAWQRARAAGAERAFCAAHLVCGASMEMIAAARAQLLAQLRALGLVKARGSGDIKDVNVNSERWYVVKAALTAGLYPSLARADRAAGALRTAREARVALHPASTLQAARRARLDLPTDWLVYEEMSRAGRLCFVRCCTLVTPLTVALFGGPVRLPGAALAQRANAPGLSSDSDSEAEERRAAPDAACIALDEWTQFAADASDAIGVFYLRQKLCALVVRRMAGPARPMSPLDEQILAAVVHVLGAEERNLGLAQPPGIGQRPRPLTVDAPAWRPAPGRAPWPPAGAAQPPPPQPPPGPRSPMSPNGKTLLANIEKYAEVPEPMRYMVVKADDVHALDVAQTTGTYPFSHNVQKKLQKFKQEGARVTLLFSCASVSKFVGAAAVAPAGSIEWLSNNHLPFHMIRHISNGLAGGARVCGARDGAELCAASGRALLHAAHHARRRAPPAAPAPAPRPIQKHDH